MKHIKKFESFKIPVFDQRAKDLAPNEVEIITSTGHYTLEKTDFYVNGNSNWINLIYHQNTIEDTGSVTADGEPDYLCFDIWFTRSDDGLNITCDISYGDNMQFEFKIGPNGQVDVIFYNSLGSHTDPDTHFAFTNESILELIKFFNRFSSKYNLEPQDFNFMDNKKDSYKFPNKGKSMPTSGSIRMEPFSENEIMLIVDNSKTKDEPYARNIMIYLELRGINYISISEMNDLKKIGNKKILGAISTGSNSRINDETSSNKIELNKRILNFGTPFYGICFGFQSLSKISGAKTLHGDKETFDKARLDYWDKCSTLFKDIDLDKLQVSFDFHDTVQNCPNGFKVIAKKDGLIVGIEKDSKIFGTLFHPEDIAATHKILDNFIEICKNGKNHKDFVMTGKFEKVNWK